MRVADKDLYEVVEHFNERSFSTFDFIKEFKRRHPGLWKGLEDRYGTGGAGAGVYYSAYSRMAHLLDRLASRDLLEKLDYRVAPRSWGSPRIRYWTLSTVARGGRYFPDEFAETEPVMEGAKLTITVNKYERSLLAREQCLEAWGACCVVCKFDFEAVYGERGAGYIQVHHLIPMSEIGKSYKIDPKNDLRPVCPNCHAMIHRSKKTMTIEELKATIRRA